MSTDVTVVCLRGPSGAGKTALAEQLLPLLAARGLRCGYLKRAHHGLDIAGKDSDRLARAGAAAVLVHDATGAALFRQPTADLGALLRLLPPDLDLVLLETFRPERFPMVLCGGVPAEAGETVLAQLDDGPPHPTEAVYRLATMIGTLCRARAVAAAAGPSTRRPHRCAGAVLGRRLAALGAALLELTIPRVDHRLHVIAENDGCAADALMAATGCHPGNRTLRFVYHGKLAATFVDTERDRAVRVWARGDCRALARLRYPEADRHLAQLLTYAEAAEADLFAHRWVPPPPLPGRRRRHVLCPGCEEEVDGDAVTWLGDTGYCRPCAAARVGAALSWEGEPG
jgi:formylmethanofuran dehydrogenase subunit E